MKIALIQFKPAFLDLEKNLQRAVEMLESISADVAVFPELFLSGYTFADEDQARACALPFAEGPHLTPLLRISRKKSMAVCGGYAEMDGPDLYNSAFFMADGHLKHNYRKVHLFNKEKLYFRPGNKGFTVFNYQGAAMGMMICFDWIFPEAARSLALQGAQVILHPANLVLPYCQQAMFARALENRVFIITVNRVGTETAEAESNTFTGQSQIVSPKGGYLVRMSKDQEQVENVSIDPDQALDKNITPFNHVLKDRRKALYAL
jgi:predicted amidohydrolase